MSQQGDPGEEGGRSSGATIGAVLAVIAIIGVGIWLVGELAESAKYSKCAAARHRNCDSIDYRGAPPPQQ